MDASFFMDVVLNFRTAYIGTDFLVTGIWPIAQHYVKVCRILYPPTLWASTLQQSSVTFRLVRSDRHRLW